jgi:hypothetical protein
MGVVRPDGVIAQEERAAGRGGDEHGRAETQIPSTARQHLGSAIPWNLCAAVGRLRLPGRLDACAILLRCSSSRGNTRARTVRTMARLMPRTPPDTAADSRAQCQTPARSAQDLLDTVCFLIAGTRLESAGGLSGGCYCRHFAKEGSYEARDRSCRLLSNGVDRVARSRTNARVIAATTIYVTLSDRR